jgi:hypothetical protein
VGAVEVVEVLPFLELVVEELGVVDDDAVERAVELGTAARSGDRFGYAARAGGGVMMVSYSMGVNRPRAA